MNSRAKGLAFEREVATLFENAGYAVRGLESGGDHFVVSTDGGVMHVECKRHERPRVSEWVRQQERDCPAGVRRLLVWRRSRQPAYVILPLEQLVAMLTNTAAGATP